MVSVSAKDIIYESVFIIAIQKHKILIPENKCWIDVVNSIVSVHVWCCVRDISRLIISNSQKIKCSDFFDKINNVGYCKL